MKNIAEARLICECGKTALVPRFLGDGGVCVCAECARAFRVRLVPVAWSEVETVLRNDEKALSDLDWLRARVPAARRRTLERPAPERRWRTASALVLAGVWVTACLLELAKAVWP